MKLFKHSILGCVIFVIMVFFCNAASADSVLIVNDSVQQTFLSKEDVKLVFLGKKKKWGNGDRIRVCALKSGAMHEAFLNTYVDKTPAKFASFWKIAIVSGTAHPPKFFESEAELVDYVKEEAGAIGYISSDTPHKGVKELSIQ